MKKKKMRRCEVFHLLIFFGFVPLSTGQTVPCAVTQGAGWTSYSVPDFDATNCMYWWSNGTNHVVANHAEKMKNLVVNVSSVALTTSDCLEKILYTRDCISEKSPSEATCTTTCIGNVGLLHIERAIRHYWMAGVVAFSLLVVVLIVFIVSCVKSDA